MKRIGYKNNLEQKQKETDRDDDNCPGDLLDI